MKRDTTCSRVNTCSGTANSERRTTGERTTGERDDGRLRFYGGRRERKREAEVEKEWEGGRGREGEQRRGRKGDNDEKVDSVIVLVKRVCTGV